MRRAVLALAALSAAAPASAAPVVLAPSSPWNVDLVDNRCRLTRSFGDTSAPHLLVFEQYWPDERAGLYVAGPAFAALDRTKSFGLKFREGQAENPNPPFRGTIEGFGTSYLYPSIDLAIEDKPHPSPAPVVTAFPALDTEYASRIEFVALRFGKEEVRLETGSMKDAFTVLNECTQAIVGNWGFDLKQQLGATRMPYLVNDRIMSSVVSENIPFSQMESGENGTVRLRLLISETGAITECKLLGTTDPQGLERHICRAYRRARFEPARDATGNPMPSFYTTTITYALG